jgi:hypothetical protein
MKHGDPLGLHELVKQFETKHNTATIDEEQFASWLQHPVTQRLMEETQLDLLKVGLYQGGSTQERKDAGEALINWKPSELRGQ